MNKIDLLISCDYEFVSSNENINNLSDTSNVFYFFRNEYNEKGDLIKSIFDVINGLENKLHFINVIVCPLKNESKKFCDNIIYILWFAKDINNYIVCKDNIREKSIWKDVEWGKRAKNYNSKGKDPGNVWIPTIDDGNGKITNHILLNIDQVINRLIDFSSNKNSAIVLNFDHEIGRKDRLIFFVKTNDFSLKPYYYRFDKLMSNENENHIFSKVIFDSSEKMKQISNSSVSVMVTSPPYWDIKNYFKDGQIGKESYEKYQGRITSVWGETYKKLKDTGLMWINVNTIFKNKKLVPIPFDIINNSKRLGFHLKACILWHKSSAIPTTAKNLCDHFEYVFLFTKTDKLYLNLNGLINDYKNEYLGNGSFWNINRKAGVIGKNYIHPAVFPNELIERIIKISSNENDVILDPFLGSGTSLIAALNSNRSFVGYEFNENFQSLIDYRIKNECKLKEITEWENSTAYNNINIFRK